MSPIVLIDNLIADNMSVPMILHCPECRHRHIDEGDFAHKVHHTHACQACGLVWRPAIVPTHGVQFLPGFRNGE
jgi:rubredoxin